MISRNEVEAGMNYVEFKYESDVFTTGDVCGLLIIEAEYHPKLYEEEGEFTISTIWNQDTAQYIDLRKVPDWEMNRIKEYAHMEIQSQLAMPS